MAYRRTKKVENRLAENRKRILSSARKLIAEGGFANAQIESVAAAAGLASGTVYRYFPSKGDLLAEVFRAVVQREVEVLQEIADGGGSASERMEGMIRAFARRAMRTPRLAYALLVEPEGAVIETERIRFKERYTDIFTQVLTDGIESGEFVPHEPSVVAACLSGAQAQALVGPLAPEYADIDGGSEAVIDETVHFCMRAISARETENE